MSDSVSKETLGFQTEVSQLLKLMIHSLYSNKEIFLRELISNASDACDKLRFEALTDASLMGDDSDLKIDISVDREKRTVSISDNGIGMSRDEVVQNIGTIAKSGTKEFFNKLGMDSDGKYYIKVRDKYLTPGIQLINVEFFYFFRQKDQ